MQLNAYQKSLLQLLTFLLVFAGAMIVIGINRPYWGDEAHFAETIRYFGNEISLNTLKSYNEMSTPLPFVLYALWGKVFGFEIQNLRILSIIIALFTCVSFHYLLFSIFKESIIALATTGFFILNPYIVGLSIFVFTDMLAILFLIICCLAVKNESPALFAIASVFGLLTRQHFAFLTIAAGLYYLFNYQKTRESRAIKMLFSAFLSFLPLLSLFVLWQGPAPVSARKALYMKESLGFHPNSLILYITQFSIYLLPVILFFWKDIYKNKKILITSFIISWLYWVFPIAPSTAAVDANIHTVGLFHKLVRLVLGAQYEHIFFFIFFFLGLPIVLAMIKDCYQRIKSPYLDFLLFIDLAILTFLLIMPFSYLVWEKYFLPVLPLMAIYFLLKYPKQTSPTFVQKKPLVAA